LRFARETATLAAAAIARYSFIFGDVCADATAFAARPQFDPQADYGAELVALACGIKIAYFVHCLSLLCGVAAPL
jgi:hypothetical protein